MDNSSGTGHVFDFPKIKKQRRKKKVPSNLLTTSLFSLSGFSRSRTKSLHAVQTESFSYTRSYPKRASNAKGSDRFTVRLFQRLLYMCMYIRIYVSYVLYDSLRYRYITISPFASLKTFVRQKPVAKRDSNHCLGLNTQPFIRIA